MKKHIYKAIKVTKVNWEQLANAVEGQRTIFAVDVAKEKFFAAVMTPDREVHVTLKWVHPQETRLVGEHLVGFPANGIDVVMEPSGTYGDSVRNYLKEHGCKIHRISPKRVYDAAEVYDGVPSQHDAKAAYLIGRLHLEGISVPWEEISQRRRDQQALVAELDLYQSEHRRNLSRLEALLSRHWPEIGQIIEIGRSSLLHLIAEYGSPAKIWENHSDAQQLLRRTGRGNMTIERTVEIVGSCERTLGVPCTEGERHHLQTLAKELLHTHEHQKALEHHIAQYTDNDPELSSIAEMTGKATSVALQSTLGSPLDYPNPHAYVKAMGLNLKEHSSGKHQGQLGTTKRGPGKARYYLYFVAMRMVQRDPVVGAWYRNKIQRDGSKPRFNALVAVMRKLGLAIWHVAHGERFDSRKLFDAHALRLT